MDEKPREGEVLKLEQFELFTVGLDSDGKRIDKRLRHMTGAEVEAALVWHFSEVCGLALQNALALLAGALMAHQSGR